MRYRLYFFVMIFFIPFAVQSQKIQVSLSANKILIGQQIDLGLKISLPKGSKAAFAFPDSIPHFEILDKKDIHAVDGENALEQVITITSFDSGEYYFPAIPVLISDGINQKKLSSDSILINVGYAADNPLQGLRDIKPVRYLEIKSYFWYFVLGGMMLFFLILFLLYDYFAKRKKKTTFPQYKNSAFDEAMQSMSALEKSSIQNQLEVRKFHSALSDIFKRYFGRKTLTDLHNKTTTDTLILLQQYSSDDVSEAASLLRANDAVSFAKYAPEEKESRLYLHNLDALIRNIENRKQSS